MVLESKGMSFAKDLRRPAGFLCWRGVVNLVPAVFCRFFFFCFFRPMTASVLFCGFFSSVFSGFLLLLFVQLCIGAVGWFFVWLLDQLGGLL